MNSSSPIVLSCPDCAAPYFDVALERGEELICKRCGKRLKKYLDPRSLQAAWALVTAALIFLFMANVTPIMVFDVSGNTQSNLIITGVESLFSQGYWPLALLVFCSAIALPALYLLFFWYLLAACCLFHSDLLQKLGKLKNSILGLRISLMLVERLSSWNLIPVFAVAVMAAVVKLDQLGSIEWRAGGFWIVLLAITSIITAPLFDHTLFLNNILELEHLSQNSNSDNEAQQKKNKSYGPINY